jgi:hypothetical protein
MLPTGYINKSGTGLTAPQKQTTKVVGIPAPIGGINAVDPLASVPPQFCLSAINLVADGRTMKVRPGYQAFATSVGDGDGVRTIIPFIAATSANNKLFAVCKEGIYDITAGGAIGAADIALSDGTNTGWGVWTNFVLDNGAHYVFYADTTDGLFQYPSGGPWVATTGITGVAETSLSFVMQHKGRLWFAERDSARGWYLAAGAVAGAATRFDFGNKFAHGGTLVGLYSWTVDGGEGVDDHLVAISSAGDVMVYKGDDPSSPATWGLVGQYYVGAVPEGRRVAAPQGGDLYILSQYGVIPLTRLMQGTLVQQEQAQLSRNIAPLIADALNSTRQSFGWEMRNVPGTNVFLVATPEVSAEPTLQFCLSTRTQGWTIWNNLPYVSGDVYAGNFYFGDNDATVWTLTGDEDEVAADGTGGEDIAWSLLTTFQEYGETGHYHRAQFARLVFNAASAPGISVVARYDYQIADPPTASGADPVAVALWDVAVWDSAIWGSSLATFSRTFGLTGIGRTMAVAIGGQSNSETGLIRIDLFFDTGGPL